MRYHLMVRDGTIIDKSGGAPYRADVGVKYGVIIGVASKEKGQREVNAEVHVVAPGVRRRLT